jgi:mersacidin/lichenicidin family type 2 lantibiotic
MEEKFSAPPSKMDNCSSKTEKGKPMKLDITRAWKDELYRQSLSEEDLLTLPESPVGGLELSDDTLDTVYGGFWHHRHHHHRHHRHWRHGWARWSEEEGSGGFSESEGGFGSEEE